MRAIQGKPPSFTPEQAKNIRDRYHAGGTSFKKLAEQLGCSMPTIADVIHRTGAYEPEVMQLRQRLHEIEFEVEMLLDEASLLRKRLTKNKRQQLAYRLDNPDRRPAISPTAGRKRRPKLVSDEKAQEIREAYNEGGCSMAHIAKLYKISEGTANNIIMRLNAYAPKEL